jgi:hypothetical protein
VQRRDNLFGFRDFKWVLRGTEGQALQESSGNLAGCCEQDID